MLLYCIIAAIQEFNLSISVSTTRLQKYALYIAYLTFKFCLKKRIGRETPYRI